MISLSQLDILIFFSFFPSETLAIALVFALVFRDYVFLKNLFSPKLDVSITFLRIGNGNSENLETVHFSLGYLKIA